MYVEVFAGSVVVIDHARGIDITDDEIRQAVPIQIGGDHRVRLASVFPNGMPDPKLPLPSLK